MHIRIYATAKSVELCTDLWKLFFVSPMGGGFDFWSKSALQLKSKHWMEGLIIKNSRGKGLIMTMKKCLRAWELEVLVRGTAIANFGEFCKGAKYKTRTFQSIINSLLAVPNWI